MAGKHGPRKLLIASVGVATINYVLGGCGQVTQGPGKDAAGTGATAQSGGKAGSPPTSGNLPAPPGGYPTVANLPAPVIAGTGGDGGAGGRRIIIVDGGGEGGAPPTSGNLPAPPLPGSKP